MAPESRGTRGPALHRIVLAGSAAVVAAGAATLCAASVLARRVVSAQEAERPHDVHVLGVGAGTLTLRANELTLAPGRYGLWLDAQGGHARLGEVIDHDEQARTVTRRLLGVDAGRLREGPARWNQYFYAGDPTSSLDLPFQRVDVGSDVGALPAWYVPAAALGGAAEPDAPPARPPTPGRWAVLVHGKGASREECLRALPVLHRLGMPALVVSYRNDVEAPTGGRSYHLGASEWRDVEAAVLEALQAGARDVVLFGWSMGGAIALQLLDRSWTADRISAVVLDAPVIDWRHVLAHHARVNRVPAVVALLAQALLAHDQARRLVSLEVPLPLDRMDWVARADELSVPILLLHSDDDQFVPSAPSRRLAAARPDLVTLVSCRGVGHTGEWNLDPQAWDTAVARFLLRG